MEAVYSIGEDGEGRPLAVVFRRRKAAEARRAAEAAASQPPEPVQPVSEPPRRSPPPLPPESERGYAAVDDGAVDMNSARTPGVRVSRL